jgi:hypothetical protein
MIQRLEHLCLALEPRQPIGIACDEAREELDCDVASQRRIARAIDFAHAAGAQEGQDLIHADSMAGERRRAGIAHKPRRREQGWFNLHRIGAMISAGRGGRRRTGRGAFEPSTRQSVRIRRL